MGRSEEESQTTDMLLFEFGRPAERNAERVTVAFRFECRHPRLCSSPSSHGKNPHD